VTNYIIDTNALISFVTDRDAAQQNQMKEIFESAALLKCRICCPQNVITEFVYVMEKAYHITPTRIQEMVGDFLGMTGVEVIHELDYKTLFTLWPDAIHDFGDAIVASTCITHKGAVIASFDKKLISALKKMGMPAQRFLMHSARQ
jgi:predicted nucleic acid-binding protein